MESAFQVSLGLVVCGTTTTNHKIKPIIDSIKGVAGVYKALDDDDTVCENLRRLKPDAFANGGDRKDDNVPEVAVCKELGIKMLWNVGGEKSQSSSELVAKQKENKNE